MATFLSKQHEVHTNEITAKTALLATRLSTNHPKAKALFDDLQRAKDALANNDGLAMVQTFNALKLHG